LPHGVAAKIVDRDGLLVAREALRREGRSLVQCHGCFDIVHPGHIRHLRQARSLGDVLLVSITGDGGISKGTGRPLIPEELRAENLAALDCVDLVCIDPSPTALDLLLAVQPDVYVKGKEYETNNDARFLAERAAVEDAGGRVVFSSGDIVFSSTALIAALEQSADPYHQRLVQLNREPELQGGGLFSLISSFRGKRVVVVGETIVDTYILCDRPEIAGESPVMTLRPIESRRYDGGAAIVARHAAAMGAKPVLVTALPDTDDAKALVKRLNAEGIEVRPLNIEASIPEKQRFLVGGQKVMKLDLVEPSVLDAGQQEELIALSQEVTRERGGADAAIITDFGLGLLSPHVLSQLSVTLRHMCGVMAGDVSGRRSNLRAFRGLDLVCPSEEELRDAMQLHGEGLPAVTWRMLQETGTRSAIVTMGAEGLVAFSRLPELPIDDPRRQSWFTRLHSEHIPAMSRMALDALGCGDSLLTTATLTLAAGGSMLAAGYLGALAASIQVQRLGNIPISATDLRQAITRVQAAHLTYTGSSHPAGELMIESARPLTLPHTATPSQLARKAS
jgi:rfaE bifunctional protein kinase chain/domain/rfaE bifunctional protein nucleotidyltransferase chain/domain